MNSIMQQGPGGLPSLANLAKGMETAASSITVASGEDLLRFIQGSWLYGQSDTQVEEGSLWAINPYSLQQGYICWSNRSKRANEILGQRMVPITSDPISLREIQEKHPMHDESADRGADTLCEWKECYSLDVVCCTGEDRGKTTSYRPSSVGGLKVVAQILQQLHAQITSQVGKGEDVVPVVLLKGSSYKHNSYGVVHTPALEVVLWTTLEGAGNLDPAKKTPDAKGIKEHLAAEAESVQREENVYHGPRSAGEDNTLPSKPDELKRRRRRRS